MSDKKDCTKCGEPPLIDGCCYDCAVLCKACKEQPAHPDTGVCKDCQPKLDQRKLKAYERLHDTLSDCIESGRLSEADIPDDYGALVHHLEAVNAAGDPHTLV